MDGRQIAFKALCYKGFIEEYLEQCVALKKEIDLAKRLAVGTCQRELTLKFISLQLTDKLPRKRKERLLLYLCIYQHYFCDRIPLYAIIDEGVKIAKNEISRPFAQFLNAVLRKIETVKVSFPEDLSTLYSYPSFFVEELNKAYGLEKTKEVLEVMNQPSPLFARRKSTPFCLEEVALIEDDQYAMNKTPFELLQALKEGSPKKILDIASSPGGKLLLAADMFPEAELFANDVSEEKLGRLKENVQKWGIKCEFTSYLGQEYPLENKFDLIICDLPCSNSGVLNKRAQARWRLSEEAVEETKQLQIDIVGHASKLLAAGGRIWYLTCSILPQENEEVVLWVCQKYGLKPQGEKHLYLPNSEGYDGGFAQCLI